MHRLSLISKEKIRQLAQTPEEEKICDLLAAGDKANMLIAGTLLATITPQKKLLGYALAEMLFNQDEEIRNTFSLGIELHIASAVTDLLKILLTYRKDMKYNPPEEETLKLALRVIKNIAELTPVHQINLKSMGLHIIPEEVLEIPGLIKIVLNDNMIEDISGLERLRNMRELHISNNPVCEIPGDILALPYLYRIFARKTAIQKLDLSKLYEKINEHKQKYNRVFYNDFILKFNFSKITEIPKGIDKYGILLYLKGNPIENKPEYCPRNVIFD